MGLRITGLLIIFTFAIGLQAQNVKKGFKKIEKQDYLVAEEIFYECLVATPDDPMAQFGLALIYADTNNPKYDYFSANRFTKWATENFSKTDPNEYSKLEEYINPQKLADHAIFIDEMIYYQININRDYEKVLLYLNDFVGAPHYNDVIIIRNHMEFEKTKAQHTISTYEEFIKKYPEAKEVENAKDLRNQIAFEMAKSENTLKAIDEFISKYPESKEINEARAIKHKLEFDKAIAVNSLKALQEYIDKFPQSKLIPDAKKLRNTKAYELAERYNSISAYKEFVSKYPDAEQVEDAKFRIKELEPYTCLPGIKVGDIVYNTIEEDLIAKYGSDALQPDSLIIGNHSAYFGTWLFPEDEDKKMFIVWKEPIGNKNPHKIFLFGKKWTTHKGIRVGLSLERLIHLNGKDFSINGFSQKGEGYVLNWDNGDLGILHEIDEKFELKLTYNKNNFFLIPEKGLLELTQSNTLTTSNEHLANIDLKVEFMVVLFK